MLHILQCQKFINKILFGKMVKACCICSNNSSNANKVFHKFPQNKELKEEWIRSLQIETRCTNNYRVCSDHFKPTDYYSYFSDDKKILRRTSIPTEKIRKRPINIKKTSETRPLVSAKETNASRVSVENDVDGLFDVVEPDVTESHDTNHEEADKAQGTSSVYLNKSVTAKAEVESRGVQVSLPRKRTSYDSLNDVDLQYFTGLERERFDIIYRMLEKFAPIEESIFWYKKDALVIALYKIHHNIDFKMMEFVFELDRKYISLIFKEVIDKLYIIFKQIDIWGASQKDTKCYRTILDCTEMFVLSKNDPSTHQLTFSPYKDHPTFKLLVGCDEMGAVNFISDAFVGSISDREITVKSGFLDLIEKGDAILADKGFDISDLLEEKGAIINIPPFLKGKEQLSDFDVMKTRIIANRRILIENINCRAKKNKILTASMPTSLWPIANKIIYICFALVNFYKPIVNKN